MAIPNFPTLEVTIEKKVGLVVLNRPNRYNAISTEMYHDVASCLRYLDSNNSVNVIVLTGNGKYFTSGNDLSGFAKTPQNTAKERETMAMEASKILTNFTDSFVKLSKPIIAGVNGPCIGIGTTILGLCDIVYCTENATFKTPFSELGQSPEGLSSYIFPRLMGMSKACEILLLGKKINAYEAEKYNLVSQVMPNDGFRQKVLEIAYKMAKFPPQGMRKVKQLIRSSVGDTYDRIMKEEIDLLIERWQSDECRQAIMAFMMRPRQKQSSKL